MTGPRRRVRGSESLIEECEAFLTGHLGESTDGSGRRASPSGWLNALAHADLQELQRLAQCGQGDRGSGDRWAQAISFLAAEILSAGADDGDAVRQIQVDLIVPIELRWSPDAFVAPSPSEIVQEVRLALARCPRTQSKRRGEPG